MKRITLILGFFVLSIVLLPIQAYAINLAAGMPVTVNNYLVGAPGSNATDQDYNTFWNATGFGFSTVDPSATPYPKNGPNTLTVDLQNLYDVIRVKLVGGYNPPTQGYPYTDFRNIFNLYSSTDGSAWSLLYSGTLSDNAIGRFDDRSFSPLQMRYVKYEEVGGDRLYATPPEWDIHWSNLAEMEVYDTVIPEPASLSLLGLGLLGLFGLRKKK